MLFNFDQIKFICETCQVQEVEPIGVFHMFRAFHYASEMSEITLETTMQLARHVEPTYNFGYRNIPVIFDSMALGMRPESIPMQMRNLLANVSDIDPDEFFQEFEEIHPFLDGNGRIGAIIWNFLKDTMESPTRPPAFKERRL